MENDVRVAASRVASIEAALGGLKNRTPRIGRPACNWRSWSGWPWRTARSTSSCCNASTRPATSRASSRRTRRSWPWRRHRPCRARRGRRSSRRQGSRCPWCWARLAILLERLDRGLRSAREVETALGLTTLGLVPRLDRLRRNQRPHQYLREKPLSSYAEAIRGVLTALKLSNPQNPPKVILVTSSRRRKARRPSRSASPRWWRGRKSAVDRPRPAPSQRASRAGVAGLGGPGRVHGR